MRMAGAGSRRTISTRATAVLVINLLATSCLYNEGTAREVASSTGSPALTLDETSSLRTSTADDNRKAPTGASNREQPNIVFVLADDVGFTDVGWNKHMFRESLRRSTQEGDMTPTLTRLAKKGIIFDQAYSQQMCSPSRAALLTGRHPILYGMHDAILRPDRPYGLPLNQRLLPESLKDLGYRTALVGKWHLGFCNASYMPTSRGFDSFIGLLTGRMDYFDHTYKWGPNYRTPSYVMHNNTEPTFAGVGEYATSFFADQAKEIIMKHNKTQPLFLFLSFTAAHTPLSAPRKFLVAAKRLFPKASRKRRAFAAVLLALDAAVKSVVNALRTRGMWNDTIFVFTADNGPNPKYGRSYPLRGAKGTLFEGGVKVPAFIHGKVFERRGYRETVLVHMSDWYPTLLSLAGGQPSPSENILEGMDFSRRLLAEKGKSGLVPTRQEMLYSLVAKTHGNDEACTGSDCCQDIAGAYRYSNLKIVALSRESSKGRWFYEGKATRLAPWLRSLSYQAQWWYGDLGNLVKMSDGRYWGLFRLTTDKYEEINLIRHKPRIYHLLRKKLLSFCHLAKKPTLWKRSKAMVEANPKHFDNFWTHGWC